MLPSCVLLNPGALFRSDARRIARLRCIAGIGLLVSFVAAPGLWLERAFLTPLPIVEGLRPLPPPLDAIVFATLVSFLVASVALRRRALIVAWLVLLAARTLWDRATWQPFFLMYAFLLLATALASDDGRDPERDAAALDASRLVVVAVYVMSAVSKLSFGFVHYVVPSLLAAFGDWLPIEAFPRFGLAFPLAELAIALGLLFPRTRDIAVLAAILMHALILVALGPFGQSYNPIVWPWNAAMIAVVVVLFRHAPSTRPRAILLDRRSPVHVVAIALFAVLPALSYAGLWPTYLSFRLYSDQYNRATISLAPALRAKLPRGIDAEGTRIVDGRYAALEVAYWSEHELGGFVPPEPAVFRAVARRVCALADDPRDLRLTIVGPPDRWTGETTSTSVHCDEL